MARPEIDREGFLTLWPTILLQRTLPGHEAANQELRRLVLALEAGHADLTTNYRSANLLADDNPAVAWLREGINRFGDHHDLHNHPHAYLSGTYYGAVPERAEDLHTRKDVRPGAITFYDPRGAVNMTAIRGDPNIEAEFTVRPKPGMLLLWPAFLHHFVDPNLSKELRISISYNVVLKWSDDCLPRQE